MSIDYGKLQQTRHLNDRQGNINQPQLSDMRETDALVDLHKRARNDGKQQ